MCAPPNRRWAMLACKNRRLRLFRIPAWDSNSSFLPADHVQPPLQNVKLHVRLQLKLRKIKWVTAKGARQSSRIYGFS
jgi:hypothetical protein